MIDEVPEPAEPSTRSAWRWPLVVSVVALGVLVGVIHSPLLAVEHIEILGGNRADVAQRVASAGLGPGALLLYVDAAAVEDAVLTDPWVVDVRVDRVWPDRVIVEVVEHTPLLWIEGVETWMLVARDGTVLETDDEPGTGLMRAALAFPDRLPGEAPVDATWDEVVAMAAVLADDIGGTLRLEYRGPELWTTALGHDVRLGFPIDLADKGRTLRALLGEALAEGVVIDVTSPQRPAVVDPDSPLEVEGEGGGA